MAPRTAPRICLSLAWAIVVALLVSSSEAAVKLCLRVTDSTSATDGLQRLVRSEVARHPSHTLVENGCQSRLVIERFQAGAKQYLSVGIEGAVPVRREIDEDHDLEDALSDGVTRALGNDPVHLVEDPESWAGRDRVGPAVLVHGNNVFRVELLELIARTDMQAAMAPGFALGLTRGSGSWQAYGRTYAASGWGPVGGRERALRAAIGLDAGLGYELFDKAMTSPYVAMGGGVGYIRFEGRADPDRSESEDYADKLGALVHLRLGVRTLRLFDFDGDIAVAGYLPLFKTRRLDSDLFGESGAYTPFVQLSVGAGF